MYFQYYVTNFVPRSEKIAIIQVSGNPVNINLVQIYAPTSDADDDKIKVFYYTISDIIRTFKKHEMTIIIGDINAKIGRGKSCDPIGDHGLGVRNERGESMKSFVEDGDLLT